MIAFFFHVIGLLICSAGVVNSESSSISSAEYQALYDFFNSTNGENWLWNTPYSSYGYPWVFNNESYRNPCDNWQGLTCQCSANVPCTVVQIYLPNHNLIGSIPNTFANLANLSYFTFFTNNINGSLPESLHQLIHLTNFDVGYNQLTGTIPSSYSMLTKLSTFSVLRNNLNGTISDSLFCNMTNLRILNFGENQFQGSLPNLQSQSDSMVSIDFSNNLFSDQLPVGWLKFHNLYSLNLQNNLLTGPLPGEWSHLTNLNYLNVEGNLLSQSLPPPLGNMSNLLRMEVSHNLFTGEFPASWCQLATLETISLYGNQLNGSLPNCFDQLVKLSRFTVQANDFSGQIPSTVGLVRSLVLGDFSVNKFVGPIPDTIGNAISLNDFRVNNNLMSGSLPSSITLLGNLTILGLSFNFFNGSLPINFGNLMNLQEFNGNHNRFVGEIPSSIGLLKNLRTVDVAFNFLTGKIPPSIGYCTSMDTLAISSNLLTGSLPEELYSLTKLTYFSGGNNFLNGSISSSIEKLKLLNQFYVLNNRHTGQLPESIGTLSSLAALGFSGNRFEGTIPTGWFPVGSTIQALYLGGNHLHGEIPSSIMNATSLSTLQFKGNLLEGSLEHIDFSVFPYLYVTDFSLNSFYGTLPVTFWDRPMLHTVMLDGNAFSGAIEVPIDDSGFEDSFRSLQNLLVGSNQFVGPLFSPAFVAHATNLTYLNATSNYFTGEIDDGVSAWIHTVGFGVANNHFSGSLNHLFVNMPNLTVLTLSSNHFSGSLDGLMQSRASYVSVALDNNALTGSLPADVFEKGNLHSFIASINCLSGTLPASAICSNSYLQELLLDGMHSSPQCSGSKSTFFGLSKATIAGNKQVTGQFPTCLLENIPTLSILHLSGNALSGRNLEHVDFVSPSLSNIDLSHNLLSGSISPVIWQHNFSQQFDISFNRISGVIDDSLSSVYGAGGSNASLRLNVNRLSGSIPESLANAPDVDILEGNMFSCNTNGLYFSSQQSSLPVHDPNYDSYECGSDATNSSLIAAFVLSVVLGFGFLLVMVLWGRSHIDKRKLPLWTLWHRWQQFVYLSRVKLHFWWTAFADPALRPQIPAIHESHESLRLLLNFLRRFTLITLICGIPLYMVLSYLYGTYTHQYIWTAALTFLRGITPSIILLIFLLLILSFLLFSSMYYRRQRASTAVPTPTTDINPSEDVSILPPSDLENALTLPIDIRESLSDHKPTTNKNRSRPIISYVFNTVIVLFDIAIVVAVNAAYVYALGQHLGVHALLFVSLGISIFKLGWSNIILGEIIAKQSPRWVTTLWNATQRMLSCCLTDADTFFGNTNDIAPERLGLSTKVHILLSIFNNVVAPYLAEAFVSANCFKYAFTQAPLISSTSEGSSCYLTYYSFAIADFSGVKASGTTGKLTCKPLNLIPANETVAVTFSRTTTISYNPAYTYSFQCSSSLLTSFVTIFILRYIISGLVLPLLTIALKAYQHSLAVKLAEYERRPKPPLLAKKQRVEAWFRLVTKILPTPLRLLESMAYAKRSAALPISTPIPPLGWLQKNFLPFPLEDFRILPLWTLLLSKDGGGDGESISTVSSTMRTPTMDIGRRFLDDQDAEQERLFLETLNRTWILPTMSIQPWYTARGLYMRLVSDLAVLCTFGVLFPPLLLVISAAMVMDLVFTKIILARLLRHFQGWISLLSQEAYVLQQLLQQPSIAAAAAAAASASRQVSVATPQQQQMQQMQSVSGEHVTDGFNPMLSAFVTPHEPADIDGGGIGNLMLLDHDKEAERFQSITETLSMYRRLLKTLNHSFSSFHVSLWNGVYLVSVVAACFWSLSLFDILGSQVGANYASIEVGLLISAPLWLFYVHKVGRWMLGHTGCVRCVASLCGDVREADESEDFRDSSIVYENNRMKVYAEHPMSTSRPESSAYRPPSLNNQTPGKEHTANHETEHEPTPATAETSTRRNNNKMSFLSTPAMLPSAPGSSYAITTQDRRVVTQQHQHQQTTTERPSFMSVITDDDAFSTVPHDDDVSEDLGEDGMGGIRLTVSSMSSSPTVPRTTMERK